jgi:hypothetical protein
MIVLMGRILEETDYKVLIEPYGTYEDWYDSPDEEMRKWMRKDKIQAINDAPVEPWAFTDYVNTEEVLEISMPHKEAGRYL